MKLALIFTNDWELFGDGSGDYFEVQHQPLLDLVNTFEAHGAKLTVMAEVFQQIKHLEFEKENDSFKKITEAWETIIQEVYSRGHDVQLHIHPQWNEAKYKNKEWFLGDNWSIGKRPKLQIEDFIKQGKSYLESVVNGVDKGYSSNCFRAGSYYIEPSDLVIETLNKFQFDCDVSVTKGGYVESYYDYRKAYSNLLPWRIGAKGVNTKMENASLMELPIYSAFGLDSEALKKYVPRLYYQLRFGVKPTQLELEWIKERDQGQLLQARKALS